MKDGKLIMIYELKNRKELLEELCSYNLFQRIRISMKFKFFTHKSLSIAKRIINSHSNCDDIELVTTFFTWLAQKREFYITNNELPKWEFRLIKKDFTLLAEISMVNNANGAKSLSDFLQVFELQYIVSVKDGYHVGTDFINSFIDLSLKVNIPIILYCSREMVSFYERFDFQWLYEQMRNGNEEWLMAYIPNIKPVHQKLPQFR